MNLKPGDVWLADLGLAAKLRPARALVIYVPLTTQYRESAYEVVLPKLSFLNRDSIASVQGLGSIARVRLERKLGELPDAVLLEIQQAIAFALDLKLDES
ncbi:MAG: transcriptional regulator [Leptolyngbya sp. ERB_1_1]